VGPLAIWIVPWGGIVLADHIAQADISITIFGVCS
jgi:hypothetical protein